MGRSTTLKPTDENIYFTTASTIDVVPHLHPVAGVEWNYTQPIRVWHLTSEGRVAIAYSRRIYPGGCTAHWRQAVVCHVRAVRRDPAVGLEPEPSSPAARRPVLTVPSPCPTATMAHRIRSRRAHNRVCTTDRELTGTLSLPSGVRIREWMEPQILFLVSLDPFLILIPEPPVVTTFRLSQSHLRPQIDIGILVYDFVFSGKQTGCASE